jgi:hypothetical protein
MLDLLGVETLEIKGVLRHPTFNSITSSVHLSTLCWRTLLYSFRAIHDCMENLFIRALKKYDGLAFLHLESRVSSVQTRLHVSHTEGPSDSTSNTVSRHCIFVYRQGDEDAFHDDSDREAGLIYDILPWNLSIRFTEDPDPFPWNASLSFRVIFRK